MVLMVATVAGVAGYLVAKNGNKQEQATKSVSKAINNVMTKFSTKLSTTVNTSQDAVQVQNNTMRNVQMSGCSVVYNQEMNSTLKSWVEISDENKSELANKLTTKLKEELAQTNKQMVKGFAFGKNESKQVLDSTTITENNMKQELETSIEKIIKTENDGYQIQNNDWENVKCTDGKIEYNQKMLIELLSKNMTKSIVNKVVVNEAMADLQKKVKQKNEQTAKGFGLGFMCLCVLCCLSSCMSVGAAYVNAKKMLPFILMIIGFVMIVSGSSSIYLSQQDPEDEDSMSKEDKDKYKKTAKGFLVSGIIFILFGLLLLGVGGAMVVGGFGNPSPVDADASLQLPKIPDSIPLPRMR